MSETCPKCGADLATGDMDQLLRRKHPVGWPVYKCGSWFDPSGFCNRQSVRCLDRQLTEAQAENKRLREAVADAPNIPEPKASPAFRLGWWTRYANWLQSTRKAAEAAGDQP